MDKPSLSSLAALYGSDKCNARHTWHGQNYLHVYEHYVGGWRNKPLRVLELGVLSGASLQMWAEYFQRGWIIGIDHQQPPPIPHQRVSVIVGDQADPATIAKARAGGDFALIVDDASHLNKKTVRSFDLLWPHVGQGGLYVIEDLRVSYGAPATQTTTGATEAMGPRDLNKRSVIDSLLLSMLRDMDHHDGNVDFVHCWPMMLVIAKSDPCGDWTRIFMS